MARRSGSPVRRAHGHASPAACARDAARVAALALALAVALPVAAGAQSARPAVTTGGVASVAQTTATLQGRVDPNGARTTAFFQYGPTTLYGAQTAAQVVGSGSSPVSIAAPIGALAPFTRYHYRLVASNRNGLVRGADRSFRTRRQPLGLTLAAVPDPVPIGRPTVLAGALTGTGNAGQRVVLLANPFPYTQGFVPAANVQLTNAQGGFAFPLPSVARNTQFRVQIPDRPQIASPIVSLGVAVRVGTNVNRTRIRRGQRVRFLGTLRPARPGAQFAIQKLRGGVWRTIAGGITRSAGRTFSRYAKSVRLTTGGSYRVFVAYRDGDFVSAAGRTIRIRRR